MTFAVVSDWDAAMAAVAAITVPPRREYAVRHGYECVESHHGTQWGKVHALLAAWDRADWLFWLDTDALVTNPSIRLEELDDREHSLVIGTDVYGLNTGAFLVRTTPRMRDVFRQCLEREPFFARHQCPEQTALACLLWTVADAVTVVPQRTFNSYPAEYEQGEAAAWQPGDFVLHLPGMANERRVEYFTRVIAGR